MFMILVVTLFTSRVVLRSLGVVDYGIYNVVGGVVAMMGIISGAMSAATSRFLTYELGRSDYVRLRQIFSISLQIYGLLSIAYLLIGETFGLWFLNTQLVIPEERMVAANWVFQFSILAVILEMLTQPFQALIIAHEKMAVYALSTLFDAFAKLLIAYIICVITMDRLLLYGLLITCSIGLARAFYVVYCLTYYKESHFICYFDKRLFHQLLSYSGWNLFGSASAIAKTQGLNVLLNMFFNPSVNAARGIATQINGALLQFEQSFYTAVRPQITKYYAQSDLKNMFNLVFRSGKMSFYLVLLLAVPIIIETPYIVELWLGQLPENVISFTRLIIAISAIESIAHPLMTSCHATGRVALYQSVVGLVMLLNIPISYVFLKLGFPPISVFVISFVISFVCLFLRVFVVKHVIKEFPAYKYIRDVIGVCIVTGCFSFILPIVLYKVLPYNFISLILVSFTSIFSVMMIAYFIGLNQSEKKFVQNMMSKIAYKIWKK